jgi:hypothetical protein
MRLYLLFLILFTVASSANAQSDRKIAIRTNAVYDLSGGFEGGVDFRVNKSMTLGPDAIYFFSKSGDTPPVGNVGNGYGVRANFYLKGDAIASSMMISLGGYYLTVNANQGTSTGSVNGIAGIAAIGYQWVFRPGFILGLLGGVIYYNINQHITLTSPGGANSTYNTPNSQNAIFYPEFTVGWAF